MAQKYIKRKGTGMLKLDAYTKELLNIGMILTGEKNYSLLLDAILHLGMRITSSDAGTLYIAEQDQLRLTLYENTTLKISLGSNGQTLDMPPISLSDNHICSYAARHKQIVNIENAITCTQYDLSSVKTLDEMTGYITRSMIVIPLVNHENELLGVLELFNPLDNHSNIITYSDELEYCLYFFASQAAVAISNVIYKRETKDLLHSFALVMSTAIDERTPYNANHTKNVANYTKLFIDYYNEQYKLGNVSEYFDENRSEQLILAALLHDIGKIVIPLAVMNKSSRLSGHLPDMLNRYQLIEAYLRIDNLEGRIDSTEYETKLRELKDLTDFCIYVDKASELTDDTILKAKKLSNLYYKKSDGTTIWYITPEELECMSIRFGTLTTKEREIMNSHVKMTAKLLYNFKFNKYYANIPKWASSHHEFLDGSGYPNHLTANELPLEIRILCMTDIFDALTSTDRPYKESIPIERALKILEEMAYEGKLDLSLVMLFQDAIHGVK